MSCSGFYMIYVSGLMLLLAVMGLYDIMEDELLWRTADPRSHGEQAALAFT